MTSTDTGGQLAADLSAILAAAGGIELPAATLPGWEGVCATEYAGASHRLREAVDFAMRALAQAVDTARVGMSQ